MKKRYLLIIMFLFIPQIVLAEPSASIDASSGSIENGKLVTATVTLYDTAAWNIKIEGSGAASCSQRYADVTDDGKSTTKKIELSCVSTIEGTIVFTVTGDITSGNGETIDISVTKNVTVTPRQGGDGQLSTDNSVKSMSVSNYNINFSNETKNYDVLVDENVNSLDIIVEPNDSKSIVNITGNTDLKHGLNVVKVQVIAENEDLNEYLINVYKTSEQKDESIKEKTEKSGFIWLVVSILVFIIIVGLSVYFFIKKKKSNKKNNDDMDNKSDIDNDIEDS